MPSRPTAGGPPPAPALANGKPPWASPPDAASLLRALARHWVKALLLGLFLGSVAAGLIWFLMPKPKYTAQAVLEVAAETPTTLPGAMPLGGDMPFELFVQTEVQRLKLDRVLNRAVDNLELAAVNEVTTSGTSKAPRNPEAKAAQAGPAPDGAQTADAAAAMRRTYGKFWGDTPPKDWLKKNLQVSSVGNFILVSLYSEIRTGQEGLEDPDKPGGLEDLVNAVVDAYISDVTEERNRDKGKIEDLKTLATSYENKLREYRQNLQNLMARAGGGAPDDRTTVALAHRLGLERYNEVMTQYNSLKGDLRRAEAELAGLEEVRDQPEQVAVRDDEVDRAFEGLPAVRELKDEIEGLTRDIESVRFASRKENDAAIVKFQQQRKAAQARLDRMAQEWRPQIVDQLRAQAAGVGPDGGSTARQGARLRREVNVLREFKAELEDELARLKQQNEEQAKNAAAIAKTLDDFKYDDRAAERIRARLTELNVERDSPDRVKVTDSASRPNDQSDLKKRATMTAMTGGGVFGATLLMVAFLEFRTRRVKAADEVVRSLGMSVVGTIPALPDPRARRPGNAAQLADSRWQQAFMESVDATRMLLLHMSRSENLRAVMITSANSGEGKTSLACYLGGSLARAVHRTLIVDCDLRRPAVHQVFDTPREPGLSDLLRGEAEVQDIVRPTPIDGLFVIPAGRVDGRAMLSLSKGELGPILDWLKEQYDFVIVDAPPVLAVADALQLSQHVDAVLFSILRDVSRMPEVYEARERLATMNVRVLGAVVSGTPLAGLGYDRRYAYGEKIST
jgi:capsular exopolysaccharide synthesis family protein